MLYSEFVDRVGKVCTVEEYHSIVEPEYYNFPGNKDEFCLKFIGRELHRTIDEFAAIKRFRRRPHRTRWHHG